VKKFQISLGDVARGAREPLRFTPPLRKYLRAADFFGDLSPLRFTGFKITGFKITGFKITGFKITEEVSIQN
jgi:hypothetical protein